MTSIEYFDRPPTGWFVLDVMKRDGTHTGDWVALMVDVDPDKLKHRLCQTALVFVHPNEYRPDKGRTAQATWVCIPGKHLTKDMAWDALEDMIATRH